VSSRLAILCPGQGAQHAAMFDLMRQDEQGAAILQQFDLQQRLDLDMEEVLQDPGLLFSNTHAQGLIVAAGMAAWECLRSDLPRPALVAGYSVGELTAYGVAGLWSATTAIDIARQRASCMDACVRDMPAQGLLAVAGLAVPTVAAVASQHAVHMAIVTGFDTCIVGARGKDLLAVQQQLMAMGARTSMLPVAVASHTPLMAAALAPFAQVLANLSWQAPRSLLIAGISGGSLPTQEAAIKALLAQLTQTIDWAACMDACAEQDIRVALELGPGNALSRMLRARHGHIACRSLADFRSLSGVLKWLHSQLD